jgi:hypothetical protein
LDLLISNLLTPMVLCYLLGLTAGSLGSDLRVPKQFYEAITIYLLFAIGFKRGVEIAQIGLAAMILPAIASILLGLFIPLYCYPLLRRLGNFSRENSASIAAHYGSVSAVAFAAALSMLDTLGITYDGFVAAARQVENTLPAGANWDGRDGEETESASTSGATPGGGSAAAAAGPGSPRRRRAAGAGGSTSPSSVMLRSPPGTVTLPA